MRQMNSIDEVVNAVEHQEGFFAIHRNGECVAVMITPSLFDELQERIFGKGPIAVQTHGQAPEVW